MKNIIRRVPINATAARVVGKGIHYKPKKKTYTAISYDAPPATYKVHSGLSRDLTGMRRGKTVVVGYLGRNSKNYGKRVEQLWLVRCDCGKYEQRNGYRYYKHRDKPDQCSECDNLLHLKWLDQQNQEKYILTRKEEEDASTPSL